MSLLPELESQIASHHSCSLKDTEIKPGMYVRVSVRTFSAHFWGTVDSQTSVDLCVARVQRFMFSRCIRKTATLKSRPCRTTAIVRCKFTWKPQKRGSKTSFLYWCLLGSTLLCRSLPPCKCPSQGQEEYWSPARITETGAIPSLLLTAPLAPSKDPPACRKWHPQSTFWQLHGDVDAKIRKAKGQMHMMRIRVRGCLGPLPVRTTNEFNTILEKWKP